MDQAFKDVQRCATLEPRNQNFQETLRRLNTSIQEQVTRALPENFGGFDPIRGGRGGWG